jgi:IS30 family transposase
MKQGTHYAQLSYEDRVIIGTLYKAGVSARSIASLLERSPNTIARELKEKTVNGIYDAKKAQHKTYWRRYRSKRGCLKVAMDRDLKKLVLEKIRLRWSPERIAGYARRIGILVSTKAVYKFVYSRSLEYYLFWHRTKKKGGPKHPHVSCADVAKRRIHARPLVLGTGHYELDFIVCKQSAVVLMVLVDRYTRFAIVRRLERKTHQGVLSALAEIKRQYGFRTITTDNDIVFRNWKEMEEVLSTPFYFTAPYHSWEKGLVENTNRWIRCFVPKKTNLATVTDDDLRSIESYLNDIPRQCLSFYTARELLVIHNKVS